MGQIEDKIKQEVMAKVFTDTFQIYEYIDSRFKLEDKQKDQVISKINSLNNELTNLLKEIKLS